MPAKKPWMKFYPSDWRADQALRICTIAARGLWIEMLCIMHEADPEGCLLINDNPVTDSQLASLTGTPPDQLAELLAELESAGVFSRRRDGVIYSRRMTRDSKRAQTARKNGVRGGNPTLSKQRGIPDWDTPPVKPPDKGGVNTQRPEARKIESDTTVRTKDSDSESHPNNCRSGDRPRATKTKFENWWSCWRIPGTKRGSKPKAMQAYAVIIRSGEKTHDELCQLVHRHMNFYEAEGREVSRMLHPLTWLNGKRWNDELVLDAPNGGNQHGPNNRETVLETAAKVLDRARRRAAAEGDHEAVAEDQAHGGSGGAAGGDLFAVVDGSLELAGSLDGGGVEPDRRQRSMVASVLDGGRRLAEPDKRHRLREPMVSHQSRKHSQLG